jgi:transposase InsO family protein
VKERYELMAAEKARFKVSMMARVLSVSRSGYYAWVRVSAKSATDPWANLKQQILEMWEAKKRRHGARRILKDLAGAGVYTTLYRVRRCMRELNISGIQPHAKKRTTIPSEDAATRPDLIRRQFNAAVPTTKLVGDITYLKTGEGWLYLAVVIDLCTRMVVGWSMDVHMKASLVVSALRSACLRGYVAGGAIFHSDRGSQYTSKEYSKYAASHDVRLSVGRTGSCHDNAVAESFFSMLKNEMYYTCEFATRAEARTAVMEYIEVFYNRQRRHSSIDYRIPVEKMEAFLNAGEVVAEAKLGCAA